MSHFVERMLPRLLCSHLTWEGRRHEERRRGQKLRMYKLGNVKRGRSLLAPNNNNNKKDGDGREPFRTEIRKAVDDIKFTTLIKLSKPTAGNQQSSISRQTKLDTSSCTKWRIQQPKSRYSYAFACVCLFVCWFVTIITQKRLNRFP